MCSNTRSSGGNGGAGIWSSSLKKQQEDQRVPKRGPGVAELEKILRNQEKIDRADRGNGEGFSSSCLIPHHSNPYSSSSLKSNSPLLPPPPTSLPSMQITSQRILLAHKFDNLNPTAPPTKTSLCGNSGYNTTLGGNGGASAVGGSQFDSRSSSSRNLSSESNPLWSCPAVIQKKNNQYPPPTMMNKSGSLPTRLHNYVEPPSNQCSYYNHTSRAPEQKMIGIKRPHPLSLDNSLLPPCDFQVSPIFCHYNRPHQSSTKDTHSASSFTFTGECHWDAKWISPLELNSIKFNSDNEVSPAVPSPPMHLFQGELSKRNVLPYQVTEDGIEDSYQKGSETSGSVNKPFYSFLEVKDQAGLKDKTLGSNHGGHEGGSSGLDLSLKL